MTMLTFEVFYNENSLTKILSFAAMARKFRIIIDAYFDSTINVHLRYGTSVMFKQCSGGVYYYDTTNMEHNTIKIQVTDYTFLNTVERNKTYLHQHKTKGLYK